jgi:branched-chain amino acid transport system permease protein
VPELSDNNAGPTAPARPSAWRRPVAEFLLGERLGLTTPLLFALLLVLFPAWSGSSYWMLELPLILCFALVVSGVNLSFGFAGELQLGQVFMFGFGAYVPMILASQGVTTDVLLLMVAGGVAAMLAGGVVAIPAMRIGGWALAMASFFLVITIPDLTSIFINWTGGLNGLTGIPTATLLGNTLGTTGLFEVTAVATIIWFVCYRNLVTSRYGVVFRVLRESPVLTQSLGFSTFKLKASVYVLGALPAGIAGCLFGFLSQILEPTDFGFNLGIGTVAASLFGGTESVYGVLFGAAILQLGPEKFAVFSSYSPVVYGGFLILAAILLRGGVARLGKAVVRKLALRVDPTVDLDLLLDPSPSVESDNASADDKAGETSAALPRLTGKRLGADGVSMSFGGVQALKDVSLAAEPGKVTALIGSNGSGKTTLLNVICGYYTPQTGAVTLGEKDLIGLRPHEVARLGIGRTFQTPTIPKGVSVRDAVASGRYSSDHLGFVASILRLPRYRRAQRDDRREAMALLELVGLSSVAKQEATSLPLGTRRLVEVVRALCANPSLLLLDEPASGLNDEEIVRLAKLVNTVAEAGATVIVIEHNFRFIRTVANTVHVLHLGRLIASGTAQEVAEDPQVVESYLGRASGSRDEAKDESLPATRARSGAAEGDHEPLLVVESLESGYGDLQVLRGLSLSVPAATIEVVLGRNGVGKTTLLSTLAGLLPATSGKITIAGRTITAMPPYRRAGTGIVLVQEGKRIFRQRTVWQNVMLGTYTLNLGKAAREELCRQVLSRFPVLNGRLSERAGGLSGGQQQMLAIAQALAARPQVLLLDEPSAGLAPAIVDELFASLRDLADDGLAIVLVEQLADKALPIADHVTLLDSGAIVAQGTAADFADVEKLEGAYFGL